MPRLYRRTSFSVINYWWLSTVWNSFGLRIWKRRRSLERIFKACCRFKQGLADCKGFPMKMCLTVPAMKGSAVIHVTCHKFLVYWELPNTSPSTSLPLNQMRRPAEFSLRACHMNERLREQGLVLFKVKRIFIPKKEACVVPITCAGFSGFVWEVFSLHGSEGTRNGRNVSL